MSDDRFLSTGRAAKLLSVTPNTVLKWIKSGRLPAVRTAGGHYRVAREIVDGLLGHGPAPSAERSQKGLVYCWEYYATDGEPSDRCRDCVVYRARALRCYEMSGLPPGSGYAGTYCKTSCEDCPYYLEMRARPSRVLVITDSVRLRDRLRAESECTQLELEFAACEYEASAIVDSFKPEYVVLDCALPERTCQDLCSHLAADPRIPGVQIILAVGEDGPHSDHHSHQVVAELPRPFSLSQLEKLIANREVRIETVSA